MRTAHRAHRVPRGRAPTTAGCRSVRGATALTRNGASSTANARVIALTAPHTAAGSTPRSGLSAAVPLVSVIDPPAVMRGAKARTDSSCPANRVPNRSPIASAVISASGYICNSSPAVNTRCSIGPTWAAKPASAAGSVRSTVRPRAPSGNVPRARSTLAWLRDATIGTPPRSATAVATPSPMPEVPPTRSTRAFLRFMPPLSVAVSGLVQDSFRRSAIP